jgi:hypothetical protein
VPGTSEEQARTPLSRNALWSLQRREFMKELRYAVVGFESPRSHYPINQNQRVFFICPVSAAAWRPQRRAVEVAASERSRQPWRFAAQRTTSVARIFDGYPCETRTQASSTRFDCETSTPCEGPTSRELAAEDKVATLQRRSSIR